MDEKKYAFVYGATARAAALAAGDPNWMNVTRWTVVVEQPKEEPEPVPA